MIPAKHGFAPDRIRVTLTFTGTHVLNNAGFIYANHRYSPTNVFDVDPTLGSSSTPGFAEWASLYRFYRLLSSSIQVTFLSQETFPVFAAVIPLNSDPGANFNNGPSLFGNPKTRVAALATSGHTPSSISIGDTTTASIAGAANTNVLDFYTSAVTTGPTNNWWWGIFLAPTANLVNGVGYHFQIKMTVDFLERQNLIG